MKVTVTFLEEVEAAGWVIRNVGEDDVHASCPRNGCDLVLQFAPGRPVPKTCKPAPDLKEFPITQHLDARLPVMNRRKQLALTIHETEELAGMAVDFWAKFEKEKPSKIPNLQTFLEVCEALGIDVFMRYGKIRRPSLRAIVATRPSLASRLKMQAHHAIQRFLARED